MPRMTFSENLSVKKKLVPLCLLLTFWILFVLCQVAQADINSGLIGYWNMDSGDINWTNNSIVDRSGNGNFGTLVGMSEGVSTVAGKYGQALRFDGTTTKITIPGSQSLDLRATNAYTLSVWVRVTTFIQGGGIFYCFICSNGFSFAMHSAGSLINFNPGGTLGQLLDYNTTLKVADRWYHVVATYDGKSEKIFVDGALTGTKSSQESIGTTGANSAPIIGSSFNGALDEVRIYNRALSTAEIQELRQAASFDSTPLIAPAAPQNLSASTITAHSITLSWSANSEPDLQYYKLYKNNSLWVVLDSQTTTYEAQGLAEGTSFAFALQAVNRANLESPKSAELSVSTSGGAYVPRTVPTYLARLHITGTLTPDATGLYDLAPATYNGLPVWTRQDGSYSFWAVNGAIWRLSTAPGNTSAGTWKFDYKTPGAADSTGSVTYAGVATTVYEDPNFPTSDQYLAGLSHPDFKPAHTLPPLTRWGWTLSYNSRVELARWGYALEFGDADANTTNNLSDPNSAESKLVALARDYPSQYKLFVMVPRITTQVTIPDSAYTVDANGNPTKTWSPEAPDSVLAEMAAYVSTNLQKVTSKAPVAVVLNGGERYLSVCGWACSAWGADPKVVAAKGALSWADYSAQRKAHQELFFTNAVHALTDATYIYYSTGNQYRMDANRNNLNWDWDYKWMHPVADYPGASMYWGQFNTGWKGRINNNDMLSQVLNAHGYDLTFNKPLSYNWVCAGWGTESGGWGDIERYYGFLKSYYTSGMISGIAGYFEYPTGGFNSPFDSKSPPHWLLQIETLGRVHAEFSYLEDILRNGDLLPGPYMNDVTKDQSAFEFPTGNYDTRVLARKRKNFKQWLISAWAADGVIRTVEVTLPVLGKVRVRAHPSGSLYDVRIVKGVQTLTLLDGGSMAPTALVMPALMPDLDVKLPNELLGEVSGNGTITSYDAAIVARHALNVERITDPAKLARCDVSDDGKVLLDDAVLIEKRALGLLSKFPEEESK